MNGCLVQIRIKTLFFLLMVLWLVPAGVLRAQPANPAAHGAFGLDHDYDSDPAIMGPETKVVFSPRLSELWAMALDRPDMETRRQAVMAIQKAHAEHLADMKAFAPKLRSLLEQSSHPLLRRAVVQALITLEDLQAAPFFHKFLTEPWADLEILASVDPALARWNSTPARAFWLSRFKDESAPWPARHSAIVALGWVREKQAAGDMQRLVTNDLASMPHRLVAAQALARIEPETLVSLAQSLAEKSTVIGPLLAAELLQHHTHAAAVELLQRLAIHPEPAVAQLAADRLLALSPAHLHVPLSTQLLGREDTGLRLTAVKALLAHRTAESVALAAPALGDVNYSVRRLAREGLAELAMKQGLYDAVVQAARRVLAGDRWQGLEQAVYLLGALDDEPSAQRVIELMRHSRPEVRLAACVGLRRLQVPETLPAALKRLQELHGLYGDGTVMESYGDLGEFHRQTAVGHESTQLYQLLGRLKYAPAESMMRQVVPKGSFDPQARAAAIWALGLLHEGKPDDQLVSQFSSRLSDVMSMEPEDTQVRMMSAISLGRMKASSAVPMLRRFMKDEITSREIGASCRWAIMQITGEDLPPLPAVEMQSLDWFLVPSQ